MCADPSARLQPSIVRESADGHIVDGALACPACGASFPVHDELLELVPLELRDTQVGGEETAQLKQRRHFDWFAEASTNYDAYQRTPFWKGADTATFARWTPRVHAGDWLLDVGCANGRSAWPFLATGATIVGFDISRKLIAQAIAHAKAKG